MDTIAAIATPPGRGGIGIVRLSGPKATLIAQSLVGDIPKPRIAAHRVFHGEQGEVLDQGLVLYFPGPHSFTGEDVIELQGHGGPIVLELILKVVFRLGARLAQPGEFSERAFLNDRIDLIQAEAVADLIHAGTEQAARAAMRSLQGEFSGQLDSVAGALIRLRTYTEAAIDFSEETIDFLSVDHITRELLTLLSQIEQLKKTAKQGQKLQQGIHIAILGPTNAGKSSLLNALSQQDTAIVTEIPGTTRDVLHIDIQIEGLPVHLMDTAGLRVTGDSIEQIGIQRALQAMNQADHILWVVDSLSTDRHYNPFEAISLFKEDPVTVPLSVVRNKIDLSHEPAGLQQMAELNIIRLSAVTGEGVDVLRTVLKQSIEFDETAIGFSARERHVLALTATEKALKEGQAHWQTHHALEILTVYLTRAHQYLGEVTGVFTTEDLLSQIFSSFCIGK